MADVQVANAARVERRVQDASGGSFWSKQQPAQVVHVFRADNARGAASVIAELRTRAVDGGWVFEPSVKGQAEAADKLIDGRSALLTIAVLEVGGPEVVLLLKQSS